MNAYEQLCGPLQQWLLGRGWRSLRPIQESAFEPISAGSNVLLVSPTASGKTEAAFLPLLNRHYQNSCRGVKIIYIAPLKALLNDMEQRIIETKICRSVFMDAFKWHGDVDRSRKIASMRSLPDILLTTPESLDVILYSPYVDKQLFFQPLDSIIIDETHYFAGNIRGGQIVSVIQRLNFLLDRDVQRVCLSATVGNPEQVLDWMSFPSLRLQAIIREDQETIYRISKLFYFSRDVETDQDEMARMIVATAASSRKSIIFEMSRRSAERRSVDFRGESCLCHVHHGSVDRWLRQAAEFDLSHAKRATTIIATCTLELGIDVGDLDIIQNEGPFPNISSYIQRIGRTGRARPPQRCHAYAVEENAFLINLAIMSLADERIIEDNPLPENLYQVLLQQIIMIALSESGVSEERIRSLIPSCSSFRAISPTDLTELLSFWTANDILRLCEGFYLPGLKLEKKYEPTHYRDLFVLFDSPRNYEVWDKRVHIGTLDSYFLMKKKEGFPFILAGRWWKASRIDHREGVVYVEPAARMPPPAYWFSLGTRNINYLIAQKIKAILLSKDPFSEYLDQTKAIELLEHLRIDAHCQGLSKATYDLVGGSSSRYVLLTYAGNKINQTIALIGSLLKRWIIEGVEYDSIIFRQGAGAERLTKKGLNRLLSEVAEKKLLKNDQFLETLWKRLDIPTPSKWLEWLPASKMLSLVLPDYLDINMTNWWLNTLKKDAS